MSNVTKVVKEVELDLADIPRSQHKEVKDRVRSFLLTEVLTDIGSGRSPVAGERWKQLQKDYADEVHGGRRTPILEDLGDMLDALKTKNLSGNKIEIGIRGSQAPKADGHNQISNEAKAWAAETGRTQYKRRFIPDEAQTFNSRIENGIEGIIDQFRVAPTSDDEEVSTTVVNRPRETSPTPNPEETIRPSVQITVDDFFSDDVISSLLTQALRQRDGF